MQLNTPPNKQTLLFSNTIGDVTQGDSDPRFNPFMEDFLAQNIAPDSSLVFISAPGLGGEENYLPNILKCFKKINLRFQGVLDINPVTTKAEVDAFIKARDNIVFFLMGGNPLTQMELIKKLDLADKLREHRGLVIGFCAGAINLSKHSIITSDEDFKEPQSYDGIVRVPITVEPHYNDVNDDKRNQEINDFAQELNETIYALPDESIITVEDDKIIEFGKVYHFYPN